MNLKFNGLYQKLTHLTFYLYFHISIENLMLHTEYEIQLL